MAVLQLTGAPAPVHDAVVTTAFANVTVACTPSMRDAAWFPRTLADALDAVQNAHWHLQERNHAYMDGWVTLTCGGSFPHMTYTDTLEPAESGDVLTFETPSRKLRDGQVQLAQRVDGTLTLVEGREVEWPGLPCGKLETIESRIDWYDCATGLLMPPQGATLLGLLVKQRRSDAELQWQADLLHSIAEQQRPAAAMSAQPAQRKQGWLRRVADRMARSARLKPVQEAWTHSCTRPAECRGVVGGVCLTVLVLIVARCFAVQMREVREGNAFENDIRAVYTRELRSMRGYASKALAVTELFFSPGVGPSR